MRLLTLNLRHGGGQRMPRLLERLRAHEADVLVLSEHRHNAASRLLREGLREAGYPHQAVSLAPRRGKERVNHLLVVARTPLAVAPEPALRCDRVRLLSLRLQDPALGEVLLVAAHLPNLRAKLPHWAALLRLARQIARRGGGAAIYLGDFNTGHPERDVENGPYPFTAGGQMEALGALGWVDAWRHLHPDGRQFTWYSHRQRGFRLDHAFLSPGCAPALRWARFDHGVRESGASDHSALALELAP